MLDNKIICFFKRNKWWWLVLDYILNFCYNDEFCVNIKENI